MKKQLLFLVFILLPLVSNAAVLIDGIYYDLNSNNKTATVAYKSGEKYTGDIAIPLTVTYEGIEYNVTSIKSRAFQNCSELTSISIPSSVTSIGTLAFSGCTGLTSVYITDIASWCNLKCDSNPLDNAQHLYLNNEEITDLVIPNSIESIRSGAFKNCLGLTSVSIPNTVETITEKAFEGCTNLTKVEINNNKFVSDYNPWGQNDHQPIVDIFGSQVKEYIFGESVTSIGYYAFYSNGYPAITSITIPKSMTKIQGSFYNCSELNSVNITDLEAWSNISGSIGTPFHLYLNGEEVKEYVVPNNVTSIENSIFTNCVSLTSITIGDQVTNIGNSVFYGCSGLTSLTIPNSVTNIGQSAFSGCSGLTSLTLSNSITSIEKSTFEGCSGLTSVTIPNSVTSIGRSAFYGCSGLASVTISNSVASIGDYTFCGCSGLTSITIPNSLTSIGGYAFSGCSSLTSTTISCEVVDNWFDGYESSKLPPLTDIKFGEGVKTIKDNAFNGFANIKTIDIANTVTSIGAKAFSGTNKLSDVTCRAIDVPEMDRTAFENSYPNYATLHVPAVSIAAYKATAPWNEFKEIVALKQDLPDDAEQCATPTITYQNGKLSFASETEGVVFNYVITDNDIKAGANAEVQLDATYHISVYAIKEGYKDSETATATLCWIDANPTTEGITQGIASVSANAVLIRSNNGILSITGAPEGTSINVYDMSGKAMGSAKASAETTNVATSLHRGDVGIVKIGEKSVKIMVK